MSDVSCLLTAACSYLTFVVCCLWCVVVCFCYLCLLFVVGGFRFVVRRSPLLFVVLLLDVRWRSWFAVCWGCAVFFVRYVLCEVCRHVLSLVTSCSSVCVAFCVFFVACFCVVLVMRCSPLVVGRVLFVVCCALAVVVVRCRLSCVAYSVLFGVC